MATQAAPYLWRDTVKAGARRSGAMLGAVALLLGTLALALATYLLWPQALTSAAIALAGYAAISALAFAFEAYKHDNDRNAARAFG